MKRIYRAANCRIRVKTNRLHFTSFCVLRRSFIVERYNTKRNRPVFAAKTVVKKDAPRHLKTLLM
jgi:hypothetical protein